MNNFITKLSIISFCIIILSSCLTKTDNNPMVGEWASTKDDDTYLLIYKENQNFIIKYNPDSRWRSNEKTYVGIEDGENRISIGDKKLGYLVSEEKIVFGEDTFIKVREIQKESSKHFEVGKEIENIRTIYTNIKRSSYGKKKIKKGCLEYIYNDPNYVNMAGIVISSDHHYTKKEYFFENGNLVFFYSSSEYDQGIHSNTTKKEEIRIYFNKGKAIKFKVNNDFKVIGNTQKIQADADNILSYFDKSETSSICDML